MTRTHNNDRKPKIALQIVDTETGQCTYKSPDGDVQIYTISNPEATESLAKWLSGEDERPIQDACPLLSVEERELALSGIKEEDGGWDGLMDFEDLELERDAGEELTDEDRQAAYGDGKPGDSDA